MSIALVHILIDDDGSKMPETKLRYASECGGLKTYVNIANYEGVD